ncbi:hypothetical protein F25303_2180 [Fusarium sp. NRRL 25303]|nr:hypothetical protein F25303_2180 [Fusarium sp. NRRL 25303]
MSIDSDDDSGRLDNVSLITQHHKVFIVPCAEQEEANDFNADFEENTRTVRKDVNMMTVYNVGGQDPLVFPFHTDCYELLRKVVKPQKIYNAALYRVLTSHLPRLPYGPPNALDFNYGKLKRYQSDEEDTAPGMEYAVASPISIENVTSVIEGVLRKANKSNVPDDRSTHNIPTGPSSDRGRSQNVSTGPYQSYRTGPAQEPEANSSPDAARSRTTSSVPTSMPSTIDVFRKPMKGSIPWPRELRNKSPIGASSMETLTLAAGGSDLNNAIRFGVDANMQRFEIHFEENGRKWSHCIGPRSTAMQYLYFDKSSAVPDRITSCYVTMKQNVPSGLRFISQSQTITAGKPEEDETAYPPQTTYPPQTNWGGWMTGIF